MSTTGPARRVPAWVITGFLGAGKTSLVNAVLTGTHGRRLAVLVNEFGELGIDGTLIDPSAPSVVEVSNGCICCSSNGDLARGLGDLLTVAVDVDGVLIETSGLAEPAGVVEVLEGDAFCDRLSLQAVLTVVDALNFDTNLDHAIISYQQLISADILALNKIDLVDDATVGAIERNVRRLNPQASVLRCAYGGLPAEMFAELSETKERSGPRPPQNRCRHDPQFDSMSLELPGSVPQALFLRWAQSLPSAVWRVKAIVQFSNGRWATYHRVGARESLAAAEQPAIPRGRVVLIGMRLDGHILDPLTEPYVESESPVHAEVS